MKCTALVVVTEPKDIHTMVETISEFVKPNRCTNVTLVYVVDLSFLNRFMTYVKVGEETKREFASIGEIILTRAEEELKKVLPKHTKIEKLIFQGDFMETVLAYVEKEEPKAMFISPDKLEIIKEMIKELSESGKPYDTVLNLCKSN